MNKSDIIKYLKGRELPEGIKDNEAYLDKIANAISNMYIGKNVTNVGLELDANIVLYTNVEGFELNKTNYVKEMDIEKAGNAQTLDKESFFLKEDGLHITTTTTSLIGIDEGPYTPIGVVEETTVDKSGVEMVRTKTIYEGEEVPIMVARRRRIEGIGTMGKVRTTEIRRNNDLGTAYVIETLAGGIPGTAKDMAIDSSHIDLLRVTTPYSISSLQPDELSTYYSNVENAIARVTNPIARNSMQERIAPLTNKQANSFQTDQMAEQIVEQMAQGVDVLGNNPNQPEISNGRQMGFSRPWILVLLTLVLVCATVLLMYIITR